VAIESFRMRVSWIRAAEADVVDMGADVGLRPAASLTAVKAVVAVEGGVLPGGNQGDATSGELDLDGDVLAGWRVACVGQALKKLLVDVPEGLPGVVAEGDKEIDVGDVGAAPVGGAFGEGSTQPCPGSGSGLEIVIPGIIEQAGRCRSERCPYCFGGQSSWLNLRECLRGWSVCT